MSTASLGRRERLLDRPDVGAAAAMLRDTRQIFRLWPTSFGFKISAWLGKVVAIRCLGTLPKEQKAAALAAYGLADVAVNCMGRSAYYCATDAIATFASQAYGAAKWGMVGETAQRAFVVVLLTLYFPCLILWTFAEPILRSLHQPESVVTLAASYGRLRTRLLVFALANSVLLKTLNAVGRPAPAVIASMLAAALAVPLGWLLIVHYDLGVVGAAYHATALEAVACAIYVIGALASPAVRRCALFKPSVRAFRGWRAYLRVALPAFATLMVEMVAWELLEFPAGLCRPTPEAALGAYAILYNIVYLAEAPAFGLGGGAASVVGNAMGAGDALRACRAAQLTLIIALATATLVTLLLLVLVLYADALSWYQADSETVHLARTLLPELCVCVFAASIGWPLSGIIAGAGRQKSSWPVSLVAYFVVGFPYGVTVAFVGPHIGFRGLFQGITVGTVGSALGLAALSFGHPRLPCAVDWHSAAAAAQARTSHAATPDSRNAAINESLPDDRPRSRTACPDILDAGTAID